MAQKSPSPPPPSNTRVRSSSRGTTIVPFPNLFPASKLLPPCRPFKWLSKNKNPFPQFKSIPPISAYSQGKFPKKVVLLKLKKAIISSHNFDHAVQIAKKTIHNLFCFLGTQQDGPKNDLINTLDLLISNKKITTIHELNAFLAKAEKLATYLLTYLQHNQYNEYFAQTLSLDIFQNGFSPQSQQDVINQYPNYFS